MNYTQKQTVKTSEYDKEFLQSLNDISTEKASNAIREIVLANGGVIDLTPNPDEDQDDLFQHTIVVSLPPITPNGYYGLDSSEYPNVFYLDLEGLKFTYNDYGYDDCGLLEYESLELNFLLQVLSGLIDYHN